MISILLPSEINIIIGTACTKFSDRVL